MHAVLIAGSTIVVVGLIIFIFHRAEKKRTAQTEELASELGLDFHPKGDPTVQGTFGELRLFNHGHSRKFANMLTGEASGVEICIFDYRYTTGGGKHQHVHSQTVIGFRSELLSLPEFELRPEGMFHKIGQAFGYGDIDFDTHPLFSKKYLLRGPNEPDIRDLFEPEKLEFFEDFGKKLVSVEAGHNRLIFFRAGKRLKPEQIRDFMEEGFRMYALFKEAP